MYRSTTPRPLDQPVTIIIRPSIGGASDTLELICCTNLRRGANTTSCAKRGARDVVRALRQGVCKRGLDVLVVTSGCLGSCNSGPNIRVAPSSSWMSGARVEDVPQILNAIEKIIAAQNASL